MKYTISILVSSVVFSIIGLSAAWLAVKDREPSSHSPPVEIVIVCLTFRCALTGLLFGCLAVSLERRLIDRT